MTNWVPMKENHQRLFEGNYIFLKNDEKYSDESFFINHDLSSHNYSYHSESFSRTTSGETLKLEVSYHLTKFFAPTLVEINRSLGANRSKEVFSINPKSQTYQYSFSANNQKAQLCEGSYQNGRHFIATPSFACSALYTLNRRFDSTGRTPINVISSENTWNFATEPEEKTLYIELQAHESGHVMIGGNELQATHYSLYQYNTLAGSHELPTHLFISKHYGLPYKLEDPSGVIVQVDKLKRLSQSMDRIF